MVFHGALLVMCYWVQVFEKYVQESKYDVFSPETLQGNWKQLTVRVGTQTNELMVVVGFHPQDLTEDELLAVQDYVKKYFVEGDGAELKVDSLYFEIIKRKLVISLNLVIYSSDMEKGKMSKNKVVVHGYAA